MKNIIAISGKMGSGKDTIGEIIQYISAESKIDMVSQNQSVSLEDLIKGKFKENSDWEIKKMAGKLKDIACLLIGCTREQLEDREFKETPLGEEWWYWKIYGELVDYRSRNISEFKEPIPELIKPTPRLLLQLLGTECGREIIHPNIWVNALFADYKLTRPNSSLGDISLGMPNWIITDVRFPNEAKAIKDRGGIVIRVNRNPTLKIGALFTYKDGSKEVITQKEHPSETGLDDYKDFDYVIENNGTIEDLYREVLIVMHKERLLPMS